MRAPTIQAPMRLARLAALALSLSWGVIGGSVGKPQRPRQVEPRGIPPQRAHTPRSDLGHQHIKNAGIVVTTVSTLTALLGLLFLSHHLHASMTAPTLHDLRLQQPSASALWGDMYPSARALLIQAMALGFCSLWLFATQIPLTVFFATRQAGVTAAIGRVELPQEIIAALEAALGATSVYREIGYLRLLAILPWFTFLFAFVASAVLIVAALRTYDAQNEARSRSSQPRNGNVPEKVVVADSREV
ncbi:hypothetical protein AX16_009005 [Volvariella volvacea WC 439]|nr:hypothetical protein AX16_009005 [Volvariella volvacea WC 439]